MAATVGSHTAGRQVAQRVCSLPAALPGSSTRAWCNWLACCACFAVNPAAQADSYLKQGSPALSEHKMTNLLPFGAGSLAGFGPRRAKPRSTINAGYKEHSARGSNIQQAAGSAPAAIFVLVGNSAGFCSSRSSPPGSTTRQGTVGAVTMTEAPCSCSSRCRKTCVGHSWMEDAGCGVVWCACV